MRAFGNIFSEAMRGRRRVFKRTVMLAGFVILIALATAYVLRVGVFGGQISGSRIEQVVILPIRSSGDNPVSDLLADGLLYSITTELSGIRDYQDTFSLIPVSEVISQEVEDTKSSDLPFHADIIVEGTIKRVEDVIQLRFEVVSGRKKQSANATQIDAPSDNMLDFQDRAAAALGFLLAPDIDIIETAAPEKTIHPDAYEFYLRGSGYLQRSMTSSDLDEAIDRFTKALEVDSMYADVYAGLGEAYRRKYEETGASQWADRAERSLEQAQRIAPELPATELTLGLLFENQQRNAEAVEAFQRTVALDPNNSAAYLGLASAYRNLGRLTLAEKNILELPRLRPKLWSAYWKVGVFYNEIGRYGDALGQFRRLTELAPNNLLGLNSLAATYERIGQSTNSISIYKKALLLSDDASPYRNLAAIYYIDKQDYAEAARMYESSLLLNERDFRSWIGVADAYYWTPDLREKSGEAWNRAVELVAVALRINPGAAEALETLALSLAHTGRGDEALMTVDSLKKMASSDPDVLIAIAGVYEIMGSRDSSLVYATRSLNAGLDPKYVLNSLWFAPLRSDPRFDQLPVK
ncbi:MAG: hypothetical protein BMS9Abin05_2523 [Rhodothermia bacterium]|nr:MAG: hypothetical protein BMS9Abin05_2523 [Rhodothermia bacterium]